MGLNKVLYFYLLLFYGGSVYGFKSGLKRLSSWSGPLDLSIPLPPEGCCDCYTKHKKQEVHWSCCRGNCECCNRAGIGLNPGLPGSILQKPPPPKSPTPPPLPTQPPLKPKQKQQPPQLPPTSTPPPLSSLPRTTEPPPPPATGSPLPSTTEPPLPPATEPPLPSTTEPPPLPETEPPSLPTSTPSPPPPPPKWEPRWESGTCPFEPYSPPPHAIIPRQEPRIGYKTGCCYWYDRDSSGKVTKTHTCCSNEDPPCPNCELDGRPLEKEYRKYYYEESCCPCSVKNHNGEVLYDWECCEKECECCKRASYVIMDNIPLPPPGWTPQSEIDPYRGCCYGDGDYCCRPGSCADRCYQDCRPRVSQIPAMNYRGSSVCECKLYIGSGKHYRILSEFPCRFTSCDCCKKSVVVFQ